MFTSSLIVTFSIPFTRHGRISTVIRSRVKCPVIMALTAISGTCTKTMENNQNDPFFRAV